MNHSHVLVCAALALGSQTHASALPQSSTLLVDLDPSSVPFDGEVSVGGTAAGRLWMSARTRSAPLFEERTSLFSLAPGATQTVDLLPSTVLQKLQGQVLREVVELPNGSLVFRVANASGGSTGASHLVLSDGTETGTVILDFLIAPDLELVGDSVFFVAADTAAGEELWSTDGTLAGTGLFEDLTPGPGSSGYSGSDPLATTATHLFFQVQLGGGGTELRSVQVGASASTLLESSTAAGAFSGLEFGSELLFAWNAGMGLGTELYASTGQPGGTRLIADIAVGTESSSPQAMGAGSTLAYFAATGSGLSGRELWRTDGQSASQVLDLNPGAANGVTVLPESTAVLGDELLFLGNDGVADREPWISDGTAAGTRLLVDASGPSANSIQSRAVVIHGRFYFVLDTAASPPQPYVSDGTTAGTLPLGPESFSNGSARIAGFSGLAWFGARQVQLGPGERELWSSDGTPAGTAQAVDVGQDEENASSSPGSFRAGPGVTWFRAVVDGEVRLFKSDGTAFGTRQIVAGGSESVQLYPLATLDGGLVYGRVDEAAGETGFGEPWFSNGVPGQELSLGDLLPGPGGSLSALSSLVRQTAVLGSRLFFYAFDGQDFSLWSTDGTAAGTVFVSATAQAISGFVTSSLELVGYRIAFAASVAAPATGLWFTDGTAGGTTNINLPQFGPNPAFIDVKSLNGRLYALLGVPSVGMDLWASDGTVGGTQLVSSFPGINSGSLRVAGSTLIVSDGKSLTAIDANGVAQPLLNVTPSSISAFVRVPTSSPLAYYRVLASGSPDPQAGIWVTDGTSAGTLQVFSAPVFSLAAPLGNDGRILFSRDEGGTGLEPWISDGTVAGTGLLVDSVAGAVGSQPFLDFSGRAGDRVLFTAEDPLFGTELHSLSITANGGYVSQGYGLGCGIASNPQLTLGGEPRLGELVSLDVEGAAAQAPVLHFVGLQADLLPIGGCSVLLASPALLITGQTDGAGASNIPFQLSTNPLWVGRSVYLQAAIGAAGGPLLGSLELTSAVELVFGS